MSLLGGCAVPRVPPMGHDGTPFRPETDERALWAQAEEEEARLLGTGLAYEDPILEPYLSQVVDRLVPPEVKAAGGPPIRIALLGDPTLNAFAMPNGVIVIHTGLLAALENEAQIATILGREIVHITHRHALQFQRDARGRQVLAPAGLAAPAGTAGAGGPTPSIFLALPLAHVAAVTGFGRRLEREADMEGMARLVRAGHDPRQAPRAFERLLKDHGDRGRLEVFFLGNRSRLEERIASTRELLRTRYASPGPDQPAGDAADFALRMRVLVRENAALDIRAGRFSLAQVQLDPVLPLAPGDPVVHLYFGDLHRLRAQWTRDGQDRGFLLAAARAAYERAARLDPTSPAPYRHLGLLYYQSKERDKAVEAFRRYLALAPDAADAPRVREYVAELER